MIPKSLLTGAEEEALSHSTELANLADSERPDSKERRQGVTCFSGKQRSRYGQMRIFTVQSPFLHTRLNITMGEYHQFCLDTRERRQPASQLDMAKKAS